MPDKQPVLVAAVEVAGGSGYVSGRLPRDDADRILAKDRLHCDRDRIYSAVFQRRLAGMGIAEVVAAPASPWQNPYVKRLIGSIRRECLDPVIVITAAHLRRP